MLVVVAFTIILGAGSCKKESNNDKVPMMIGQWNLKQYGEDANNNGDIDDSELVAVSGFSKYMILDAQMTYLNITVSGFIKDTLSGKWDLPDAQTYRTVSENGDTAKFTIKDLTSTSLVLLTQTNGLGTPYWQVFTKK